MNQDSQYQYRMTEAKLRMRRRGSRRLAGSSKRAKKRLIWSLILIFGYVLAAIALYAYSLT